MSGIQLTTDNKFDAFSVDAIIKKIKESQENVLKAFEEHNTLVNKSLELLSRKSMRINGETFFEHNTIEKIFVKVKDPLEEIKNFKKEVGDSKFYSKYVIFATIIDILLLYGEDKISSSFKDIFLQCFKFSLELSDDKDKLEFFDVINLKVAKQRILKVRDIRWLLLEMEKYPQFFQFTEDDLTIMKENGASRDNIYLVKKFLKKDGDYEDYYSEEEGGGIKLQYHMTGGQLNGEYKEFYKNGKIFCQKYYKDGNLEGESKTWFENGQLYIQKYYKKGENEGECKIWHVNGQLFSQSYYKKGKREGDCKWWHQNGNLYFQGYYKEDKEEGDCKWWHQNGNLSVQEYYKEGNREGEWVRRTENGKLNILSHYKEGKLHGKYTEYKEDGTYLKECFYTEGKLINLRTYNTSGHLELKKSLINDDTYELSRYYECDGKIHYKVIMEGDKWNGEYKSWWHNGSKCIETTYKDDKIHGEYTYWNEDGTLREKKYYNEGMIELNNSNFYISPTNHLYCDIKDTIVVLFYTEEIFCKDFLPKFKNFSNITKHIKYAMCNIEKYPEVFELIKKSAKPFTFVPSILIYNKGSPLVRYDGELDDKKILEVIKDVHYKATFGSLSKDINNMINKV